MSEWGEGECRTCGEPWTRRGLTVKPSCDCGKVPPADLFDQRLADIENAVVKEKNAEIERLTDLVRQTHREYVLVKASLVEAMSDLDEARRTGIVSSGGKSQARHERRQAEIERDAAQAELAAARPIVEAAKAWRDSTKAKANGHQFRLCLSNLAAAIDAARAKEKP